MLVDACLDLIIIMWYGFYLRHVSMSISLYGTGFIWDSITIWNRFYMGQYHYMGQVLYGTCIDFSIAIWDGYRCQYHYVVQVLFATCIHVSFTIWDMYRCQFHYMGHV